MDHGAFSGLGGSAFENVSLDDPLPFDRNDDRPEPEHPAFVWVRFAAENLPANGLDYVAEPKGPSGEVGVLPVIRLEEAPALAPPPQHVCVEVDNPPSQPVEGLTAPVRTHQPRFRRGRPTIDGIPKLLSVEEVADHLGLGAQTVRGIPASELPFVGVGRSSLKHQRRYLVADVQEYISRRREEMLEADERKVQWERAGVFGSEGGRTSTSGSTTRGRGGSTASPPTQKTSKSLSNAFAKLKGK